MKINKNGSIINFLFYQEGWYLQYTCVCGCLRTKDGSEEYDCGDVIVHKLEEERRLRKGGDESKYSKGFQVGARVWRKRELMVIGEVSGLE